MTEPVVPVTAPHDRPGFLLVEMPDGRSVLLPLERIERLAEVDPRGIERINGRSMLTYRGVAIPLAEECMEFELPMDRFNFPMVVLRGHIERFGLLLSRVLDVVEAPAPEGAAGTAIIAGEVAERIDVDAMEARLLAQEEAAQ